MNDLTTREYAAGIVECRICGLKFLPDLEEDRELHQQKHWQILCGAFPYDVREFIKRAAWDTLRDNRASANQKEIGPAHFPDPTPGGYGGPKSTTPVPGPAAAPAGTVSKVVRAVRPAATPVASTSPIVAARPFTVPWARDVS